VDLYDNSLLGLTLAIVKCCLLTRRITYGLRILYLNLLHIQVHQAELQLQHFQSYIT
jgi:hypothetical protein